MTREPGGSAIGERIRALLLAENMTAETELLLMFAARRQHVVERIDPALASGVWVLCDRFTDASYAYQAAGRGLSEGVLKVLEGLVHPQLQPDLTILFDVAPEVAAARISGKQAGTNRSAPDRFEQESIQFFQRVRARYLKRAEQEPDRFRIVDAGAGADYIQNLVEKYVISI